jgi:hypothetical protein
LQLELIQALDKHRRGRRGHKQTVEVRHVHIYPGAQGVVGIINSGNDGSGVGESSPALDNSANQTDNTMRNKLPMHLSPRCGARTRSRNSCQAPAMPNGRCRMHGGMSPGAPKGNKNALTHGLYTAEAIARRRQISGWMRSVRAFLRDD